MRGEPSAPLDAGAADPAGAALLGAGAADDEPLGGGNGKVGAALDAGGGTVGNAEGFEPGAFSVVSWEAHAVPARKHATSSFFPCTKCCLPRRGPAPEPRGL